MPTAVEAVSPEQITHTGLRRLLVEMYNLNATGQTPDLDGLRERLRDRPDLAEAALKLQYVGQHMQDREQWLARIVRRFAELKAEAEERSLREQLTSAGDDDATKELLRRLQGKPRAAPV